MPKKGQKWPKMSNLCVFWGFWPKYDILDLFYYFLVKAYVQTYILVPKSLKMVKNSFFY